MTDDSPWRWNDAAGQFDVEDATFDDIRICVNCGRPVTLLGASGHADRVYCARPRCREQHVSTVDVHTEVRWADRTDAADREDIPPPPRLTPDTIHTVMDFQRRVEAGEVDPYYAATGIPREEWIEVEVGGETHLAPTEVEAHRIREYELAKQHFDSVREQEESDDE